MTSRRTIVVALFLIPIASVAIACGTDYSTRGLDAGSTSAHDAASSATNDGSGGSCDPLEIPGSATDTASVTLSGLDFGATTIGGWKSIGFDLDGKCTTETSTDVCALTQGADLTTQLDGNNGIDNSFGENTIPLFQTTDPTAFVGASAIVVLQGGAGVLYLQEAGDSYDGFAVPLVRTKIATDPNGGGTLAGIIPVTQFVQSLQEVAGRIDPSLCGGATFQGVAEQMEQTADLIQNAPNNAGAPCDGISIGVHFTSTTSSGGLPDAGPNPCGDGGS